MMHRHASVPIVNHGPVPNYRMLVWRGEHHWLAMLPQFDLIAQGSTRAKAVASLRGLATASYRFGWVKGYRPSPERYQRAYRSRRLWTGDGAVAERPKLVPIGTKQTKAKA